MLETRTIAPRQFHQTLPTSPKFSLSPVTRNYICRLLRQVDKTESAQLMEFTTRLSADSCAGLNERLSQLYSDESELNLAILQIDNLVYLHKELVSQASLYAGYREKLIQIRQQIFQLLGFRED